MSGEAEFSRPQLPGIGGRFMTRLWPVVTTIGSAPSVLPGYSAATEPVIPHPLRILELRGRP